MEREGYKAITGGIQAQLPNAEPTHQSEKKIGEVDSETTQLKARIMESENEIKRLKEIIVEIDFENRLLKTKIAAAESENEHLLARINGFDVPGAEPVKRAGESVNNAFVNTFTPPHTANEIVYLDKKINNLKNVKGWVSLGIVLIIAAAVLLVLNAAYKI
jgi:chromosome segregation ATPase